MPCQCLLISLGTTSHVEDCLGRPVSPHLRIFLAMGTCSTCAWAGCKRVNALKELPSAAAGWGEIPQLLCPSFRITVACSTCTPEIPSQIELQSHTVITCLITHSWLPSLLCLPFSFFYSLESSPK